MRSLLSGEISLAGLAPAITAAVYHATGVRVRDLPVRIEDLLLTAVHAEPLGTSRMTCTDQLVGEWHSDAPMESAESG